jgi:hypothetical protein
MLGPWPVEIEAQLTEKEQIESPIKNMFLKLKNVNGESKDKAHTKDFETAIPFGWDTAANNKD